MTRAKTIVNTFTLSYDEGYRALIIRENLPDETINHLIKHERDLDNIDLPINVLQAATAMIQAHRPLESNEVRRPDGVIVRLTLDSRGMVWVLGAGSKSECFTPKGLREKLQHVDVDWRAYYAEVKAWFDARREAEHGEIRRSDGTLTQVWIEDNEVRALNDNEIRDPYTNTVKALEAVSPTELLVTWYYKGQRKHRVYTRKDLEEQIRIGTTARREHNQNLWIWFEANRPLLSNEVRDQWGCVARLEVCEGRLEKKFWDSAGNVWKKQYSREGLWKVYQDTKGSALEPSYKEMWEWYESNRPLAPNEVRTPLGVGEMTLVGHRLRITYQDGHVVYYSIGQLQERLNHSLPWRECYMRMLSWAAVQLAKKHLEKHLES